MGIAEISREGSPTFLKVHTSLRKCRSTNIASEDRFARIAKHMMSSQFGQAASIASMAAMHPLSELASMHGTFTDQGEKEDAVP